MSSVLTVEAKLTGDATSMVGAASKGAAALLALEAAAKAASKGLSFKDLGKDLGHVLGGIVGTVATFGGKVVEITGKVVASLAGLTVKAGLATAAVATVFGGAAIKSGLDRLMSIQDATVALTRMLGSAEAAADLTGKALKVVQGTPFAFPQFAEATRTLVAFGVKTEKIPGILQAIADSAAASGRGAEAVNGITQAFANMSVTGKISSDIIQSLGTSGVNALGILANHFGVSTGEAQAMVSDGLIPANEAMDILVKGIEEGSHGIAGDFNSLAGAAQDLGKTISGSLGNVKAAFARMGASWLKPFEVDFPRVLNDGVIPLLDTLGRKGQEMTTKLADTGVLENVTKGFEFLTKAVGPAVDSFFNVITMLSPLALAFKAIEPYLPRMNQDFEGLGTMVAEEVIPALVDLVGALVPLLPAITEVVTAGLRGFIEILPAVVGLIGTMVDIVRPLLGVISDLPGPLLGVITALAGLQAMGVPVSGALSAIAGLFTSTATTATVAGTKMGAAATLATGPWGIALALLAIPIGAFVAHQQTVKQTIEDFTASLDRQTGALTTNTKELAVNVLQGKGAYEAAEKLGISRGTLTAATLGDVAALDRVNQAMELATGQMDTTKIGVDGMSEAYWKVAGALGSTTREMEAGITADQLKAQAMGLVTDALAAQKEAFDVATTAVTTNGATLDLATESGQKNKTALDNLATSSTTLTDAMQKEGASHAQIDAAVALNRENFITLATKMTGSKEEATRLADEMLKIPNVDRKVTVDNRQALFAISETVQAMARLASNNIVIAGRGAGAKHTEAIGGVVTAYAKGGTVGGAVTRAASGLGRVSQMAKGGDNILWAEPETGWEAYISGNDLHKKRNQGVWMDAGERLGMFDNVGDGGGGGITIINNITAAPGMSEESLADKVVNKTRFSLGG